MADSLVCSLESSIGDTLGDSLGLFHWGMGRSLGCSFWLGDDSSLGAWRLAFLAVSSEITWKLVRLLLGVELVSMINSIHMFMLALMTVTSEISVSLM